MQALRDAMSNLIREQSEAFPQLSLLKLNCYIAVDNIKTLLDTERQKRCLEKLCIMQSMLASAQESHLVRVSLLVINDCHIDEIAVFREHVSVFAEHMFLEVHFNPMNED